MRCRPGLAVVVAALWLLAACAGRLPEVERAPSLALVDHGSTTLGREVAVLAPERADLSGIHLLGDPRRAFATYLGLAAQAERSLDVQYYTLHNDTAGWLIIQALLQAAERGVRVRLLLDDLHTVGLDRALLSLDAHPAIEVRLFNPFPARYMRLVDLVRDFDGSNRRMHNKSFTADNAAAIMGGRNIGDAYFGLAGDGNFADLDLLAVGPVVREVSAQFDRYWNSPWAFPASAIIDPFVPPGQGYLARRIRNRAGTELARDYLAGLDPAVIMTPLRHLPLAWSPVRLVVDPPEKIADGVEIGTVQALLTELGTPTQRLDVVTAYLVMRRPWIDVLESWVDRGVKIRILTNSLAGIDVPIAHAGHLMRRRPLLLAGVEVWEKKADGDDPGFGEPGPLGPAPTLHAKAAAVDGKRLFVGSLNLDQRSAYLNTEMGVIIENPALAQELHRLFDERLADHAYRVEIGERSRLVWIETAPEGEIRYDREPQAGFWRWIGAGVAALLPIDWLL
jgi:putative cardiolipin synthase